MCMCMCVRVCLGIDSQSLAGIFQHSESCIQIKKKQIAFAMFTYEDDKTFQYKRQRHRNTNTFTRIHTKPNGNRVYAFVLPAISH